MCALLKVLLEMGNEQNKETQLSTNKSIDFCLNCQPESYRMTPSFLPECLSHETHRLLSAWCFQ